MLINTKANPDSATGTQPSVIAKAREEKRQLRPLNKLNASTHGMSVYDDEEVVGYLNKIFIKNKSVITKNVDENDSADDFHQFEFLPKVERRPSEAAGVSITVQAEGKEQPFRVTLNPVCFVLLLKNIEHKIGDLDIKQMPDPIKCAIADAIFANTIEKIEQWSKTRLEIKTIQEGPVESEDNAYYIDFRALFGRADNVLQGQICLQKGHLKWLAQVCDTKAFPKPALNIERLPLNVSLIAGKTRLALKDIKSLESMDIVVLDKSNTTRGPQKLSNAYMPNGVYLFAVRKGDDIVVTQIGDDPMNDEKKNDAPMTGFDSGDGVSDDPVSGAGPGDESNNDPMVGLGSVDELNYDPVSATGSGEELNIEDINVDLLFELGRKQISLKELKTVRPGYVFSVTKTQNPIEVIVNGSKIGSGELVLLDEKIGVRLLEFSMG